MSKPSSQKEVAVPNLVIAWLTGVSGETPPPSYWGADGLPAPYQGLLWVCALAVVVGVILGGGRLVYDYQQGRVAGERLAISLVGLALMAASTSIVAALA